MQKYVVFYRVSTKKQGESGLGLVGSHAKGNPVSSTIEKIYKSWFSREWQEKWQRSVSNPKSQWKDILFNVF